MRLRRTPWSLGGVCTILLAIIALIGVPLTTSPAQAARLMRPHSALTGFINPFIGTADSNVANPVPGGASGGTFPGASAPFGRVEWSPDTTNHNPNGYRHEDSTITDFSLTHLDGAGCTSYQDFPWLPTVGTGSASTGAVSFQHANESASAGYYSVTLDNGVHTELTATQRTGMGRFTFPASTAANLYLNANNSGNGGSNVALTVDAASRTIRAQVHSSAICGSSQYTVYMFAQVDRDFSVATPGANQAVLTFNTTSNPVVQLKAAVSFVSVANAQADLSAENAGFDFNAIHTATQSTWNDYLNKIQVSGGSDDQKTVFYTALYHSLLHPNVFTDTNGQYMGADGVVHTANGYTQYANFSGWDVYRSQVQLLAILAPNVASDFAQSLVVDGQQCGALPLWFQANAETGVMVGWPAINSISDIAAFGATNFDKQTALNEMVHEATTVNARCNNYNITPGLGNYISKGYVTTGDGTTWNINGNGSASITQEWSIADFALSQFAKNQVNDATTAAQFLARSKNWRNVFQDATGHVQPRNGDGSFGGDASVTSQNGFVEGNAAQYTFMVPHDNYTLVQKLGGPSATVSRLDDLFTQLNAGLDQPHFYIGNEPQFNEPWVYDWAQHPAGAQSVVNRVRNEVFNSSPGGLPGNDDLGATSSWYVFAALGMYPEVFGTDVLAFNSPQFPSTVINLPNGHTVTINANGVSTSAPYIQNLQVNGQASNHPWVRFSDISNGATLNFTMGTNASSWGTGAADGPPDFEASSGGGGSGGGTLNTSFETGDQRPAADNQVDSVAPSGGLSNVGGICCNLTGPEMGVVAGELSHAGASAIRFSGKANGGSTNYAYLKMFDTSILVGSATTLSYWVYPESSSGFAAGNVSGNNSTCVAIDLVFSNGSNLRDSGATDQNEHRAHPAYQCTNLSLDTWNHVTVNLGSVKNGQTITRIDLGYDQPNGSGGYRGYLDDVTISG
ncbi:MAG: glycoside hydrolase family 92 protein [Ktedonobacterales bacterium]|nr:glycoside hydrolase family 92 protein [Ktedonobacterales bacterium]